MYNEVNTKCNLPAQIDIEAVEGNEYRFLCVTKGGGSANKTYLYQETKARIQNPGTLVPFLVEKMRSLDTAACIQCSTCSEVCPHKNFTLTSDGLKISGKCEYCLACIHNCPQHALSLERERNKNARYRHPSISLNEIKKANKQ